jgi:hypothetical protein
MEAHGLQIRANWFVDRYRVDSASIMESTVNGGARIANPRELVKLFFWKAGGAANNCSENKTCRIANPAERVR